jgi:hypothetical protein
MTELHLEIFKLIKTAFGRDVGGSIQQKLIERCKRPIGELDILEYKIYHSPTKFLYGNLSIDIDSYFRLKRIYYKVFKQPLIFSFEQYMWLIQPQMFSAIYGIE